MSHEHCGHPVVYSITCPDCCYEAGIGKGLEEAAKHFRSQIRTYTGEQVAKCLLDLKDGKFIRALKGKDSQGPATMIGRKP